MMPKGTIRPGSKAPEILRLHDAGAGLAEITRRVGCSKTNVTRAIQRHRGISAQRVYADALSPEDRAWLVTEAERRKTTVGRIARAMLIDAIYEAREDECSNTRSEEQLEAVTEIIAGHLHLKLRNRKV